MREVGEQAELTLSAIETLRDQLAVNGSHSRDAATKIVQLRERTEKRQAKLMAVLRWTLMSPVDPEDICTLMLRLVDLQETLGGIAAGQLKSTKEMAADTGVFLELLSSNLRQIRCAIARISDRKALRKHSRATIDHDTRLKRLLQQMTGRIAGEGEFLTVFHQAELIRRFRTLRTQSRNLALAVQRVHLKNT